VFAATGTERGVRTVWGRLSAYIVPRSRGSLPRRLRRLTERWLNACAEPGLRFIERSADAFVVPHAQLLAAPSRLLAVTRESTTGDCFVNEDELLAGCMARLSMILSLQETGLERRDAEVLADRRGDRDRGRLAVDLLLNGRFAADEGGRIMHRRMFCRSRTQSAAFS
jgi:hypothetical protein